MRQPVAKIDVDVLAVRKGHGQRMEQWDVACQQHRAAGAASPAGSDPAPHRGGGEELQSVRGRTCFRYAQGHARDCATSWA